MYFVAGILFKLRNNGMFSEFENSTKFPLPKCSLISLHFFSHWMPCKQMVTNCWDENQQLQPWLFVHQLKRCPVDKSRFTSILSRFNANWSHALFDTKLKDTWKHYRISTLRINKRCRTINFVPLWGLSDFLSNRAGFREELHCIQLA